MQIVVIIHCNKNLQKISKKKLASIHTLITAEFYLRNDGSLIFPSGDNVRSLCWAPWSTNILKINIEKMLACWFSSVCIAMWNSVWNYHVIHEYM